MAQSAASLQAAAACSTRLSLPPKRFQLTSCSPRLIRPSEEEGRCILSSCRTHLHVQRTGWKRSLPDELPERASGLAEIRGELVPRFAGESYLATDNGPVLLNPVGNGSGTNRAALGWFTSTTSATSTTTWPSPAAEAVEAAAGQRNSQQSHRPQIG